MQVDFYASEKHYKEHIYPIYEMMPEETRGIFTNCTKELSSPFVVVASFKDYRHTRPRKAIYLEHGAGQTYSKRHPWHAGGVGKEDVILFLCPSERVADINRKHYPSTPSYAIGCPKLDMMKPNGEKTGKIAVSFHWEGGLVPETRSSFPYFREGIRNIKERYELIGHSHPRIERVLKDFYESEKIPYEKDFENVIENADIYICDNSSTIFEFAAMGKPVVVLNAPWYRRNVEHGMRFWEYADIGIQVDRGEDLGEAIEETRKRDPQRKRREEIVKEVYFSTDGEATKRAIERILEVLN